MIYYMNSNAPEISARKTSACVPGDVYTDSHHGTAGNKGAGETFSISARKGVDT